MNSTKKGFIKAGTILSIVMSAFLIITGFVMFGISSLITEQNLYEVYESQAGYTITNNPDGSYEITYTDENGILQTITQSELQTVAKVAKSVVNVCAVVILAGAIASMTVSILLLSKVNKGKSQTGLIIANLVLDILFVGWISAAFMIVSLCLKDNIQDKKPTLDNIDTFANDNQ